MKSTLIQFFEKVFQKEWGKFLIAIGILVAVLVMGLFPLFNGKSVYEDDVTHYYIPAFKWYSESLKSGENIAITPEVFSGFPLALSQVGGFYDPLNRFLFSVLPFLEAYHLRILLNYFLGGMFMLLFARSLRLSFLASLVAMFSFITAQYIIPGANILRSSSFFIIPALFFAIHELHLCVSEKRLFKALGFILLGAIVIAESFLSGYTQLNLYGLIAAGMFVVYLAYRTFSIRFLFFVSALFIAGIVPIVPYIAAVLELTSVSTRAGGLDWQSASQSAGTISYIQNLTVNLLIPPWHGSTLQSLYIGIVGFFFFFISFFYMRRNPLPLFFGGLFIFSIVSSFPYPFFYLMHALPVLEFFRFPTHWFFIASFAMSALAGIGVENLRTSRQKYKFLQQLFYMPRLKIGLIFACVLNFVLPLQFTIAQYSIPSEILLKEPWVVKKLLEIKQPLDQFRTYQLYPADLQWFGFSKVSSPTKEQSYSFNGEYTHTHLTPLLWNIDSVRGFDNLVPRRYAQVLAFLERKKINEVVNMTEGSILMPEGTFSLLGMMNVKFFWSAPPLSPLHENDAKIVASTQFKDPVFPVHLYENRRFLPRFYVPSSIVLLSQSEDNFSTIIEQPNDFSKRSFIECTKCTSGTISQVVPTLSTIEAQNDLVLLHSEADSEYWLVVSNSFVPGWTVYVDGKETELYYANYIYQGILIPAGVREVRVQYEAPYSSFF